MSGSQKKTFLYALIVTLFIFNLGIFFGYMLEISRVNDVNKLYIDAEMELLDQVTQKDALDTLNLSCDMLISENIKFGDRIFAEALQIQKYEDANRITSEIILQHKRFDLLRAIFWINSIKIKQQCSSSYHNVIYFYKYNNPSLEQKSKQRFFSNLLLQVKQDKGEKIMLIPIAADNNISSIDLFVKKYDITQLPTVLIDENIRITDVKSIEDIEKYLI